MMMNKKNSPVGLALSGGGFRAAVFHIGVLRWLAEQSELENIKYISTVSGGSLLIGLIFHLNECRWPNSHKFIEDIYPKLRDIFTDSNLQLTFIKTRFNPLYWRYFFSGATVLSKSIEACWGIKAKLSDLAPIPTWSVNACTLESGKRFRFKQNSCGDYHLGYTSAKNFKLVEVMSLSAGFPLLIGPLVLRLKNLKWYKRKSWDEQIEFAEEIKLPYKYLHIYDGGLYDNLGLESLFDSGTQVVKDSNIARLFVSDAGAPLKLATNSFLRRRLMRLIRIINIISDQSRALRVRSMASYFKKKSGNGLYFQIGCNPVSKLENYTNDELIKQRLLGDSWMSECDIELVSKFKTSLTKIRNNHFDLIERHGYETAKLNYLLYPEK